MMLCWPRSCPFWHEHRVRHFLKAHRVLFTDIDGCMYGMQPSGQSPYRHTFIRKPWRIACLNSSIPKHLNKQCDGDHQHHPCEGRETVTSYDLTSSVNQIICSSVARDAAMVDCGERSMMVIATISVFPLPCGSQSVGHKALEPSSRAPATPRACVAVAMAASSSAEMKAVGAVPGAVPPGAVVAVGAVPGAVPPGAAAGSAMVPSGAPAPVKARQEPQRRPWGRQAPNSGRRIRKCGVWRISPTMSSWTGSTRFRAVGSCVKSFWRR